MICRLASTAIAVLPAHLQYQAMQRQKIMEFSMEKNCDSKINLSKEFRAEPNWWMQNIHLNKGKTLLSNAPQIIIASDTSLKGWSAYCHRHKMEDPWTLSEQKEHIYVLQLIAAKYTILIFTWLNLLAKSIHVQMGNVVALSLLIKISWLRKKFFSTEQRDLGLLHKKWDHDYCKVSSMGNEQESRLSVTKREEFKRV